MRIRLTFIITVLLVGSTSWSATSETTLKEPALKWGGFIDTYYAFDFNAPKGVDRAFTTQPVRHNEFNINLAFLEAKLATEAFRGRLALQAGTSVQSNYSSEPSLGSVSGPLLSRHLQEAYVGYQIVPGLWVDAGIFFSHIGFESFISRDNWTYSRSLMSDYSPYYQTGVRLGYTPSAVFSAEINLLNGWQNISENNEHKALGVKIAVSPVSALTLSYSNFIGVEAEFRQFNDWIIKWEPTASWSLAAVGDLGFQKRAASDGFSTWWVATLLTQVKVSARVALAARAEYYSDPDQVIVVTGTARGFQTAGASLNCDVQLHPQVTFRTEVRGFYSLDPVYPTRALASRTDGVAVSSLSLSF